MTLNDDPTTKAKPTLAEILAIIAAAPLPALVEIRDALRKMRDQTPTQVVDDQE